MPDFRSADAAEKFDNADFSICIFSALINLSDFSGSGLLAGNPAYRTKPQDRIKCDG